MFSDNRKKLSFYNLEELQPAMTTIFTDIILSERGYGRRIAEEQYEKNRVSNQLDKRNNRPNKV